MENKVSESVMAFSKYAESVLREQEVQLKSRKVEPLLSGKLARIQIFNEHLEILKTQLQKRMDSILSAEAVRSGNSYDELETALKDVFAECVSEYLCLSFVKEKEQ